ncbi:Predicted dehydrogenase [Actinokineospora alba]|uniref:Predicted dehydrogenase n=1 Tax=Actinokineospora alba TaxID=504798 RepID=A0A1H0PI39_9PSEU|nr:Gfo/Idh/MocA family oxidoreductase [Actinokineospora alba]TDP65795.1 putative dehydrogenase [Actinokineospora alba]SDI64905.1 Predicted dehydrogenase [Actinokineospora alba]SDP04339.1 Predicted dehydrogenase [Actinokineospora alba]
MGTIGLAVIGAGYWGPNLVRNAQATPGLRLEYLCDLDLARARRVLGDYSTVRVSDSLDEVLADPAVQAVAIATPAKTHLPVAMAALEAGKHVLVEKPLAATYAEGRQLVEAADSRGLTLMLDHTYCYTPAVAHLRELVRGGGIGSVQYLDSVRINLGLVQPDVDVLWDLAPHDLSIFLSILPDDVRVLSVAAHGSDPIGAGHACVAHLTIQLTGGAMAHVHVNWLSPTKIRTMVIGGSTRTVVWDDLNPTQRLSVYDRGVERTEAADLGEDRRAQTIVSYRTGDMVAPALPEKEALRAVMTEFHASITERRAPLTDGRSGLQVLSILEAASASLAQGGVFMPILGADLDLLDADSEGVSA